MGKIFYEDLNLPKQNIYFMNEELSYLHKFSKENLSLSYFMQLKRRNENWRAFVVLESVLLSVAVGRRLGTWKPPACSGPQQNSSRAKSLPHTKVS
jgi:hypothetical protein